MAKAVIYNQEGKQSGELELPKEMWEVPVNKALVQQAVVTQQANARVAIAHTKTRGEVRGGGRKPWKQKGTGNARHGSIRSPLWRGGGITFGPRSNRNFSLAMNKKAKKKALFMVLSNKLAEQKITILESLTLEQPKTKKVLEVLKKLPNQGKTSVIITTQGMPHLSRSLKNVPTKTTLPANSLNVYDLLRYDSVVIPKESIELMHKTYLPKAAAAAQAVGAAPKKQAPKSV